MAAELTSGAWAVELADPGLDCSIAAHGASLGEVSDTMKSLVTDGTGGAVVNCFMTSPLASSFDVVAEASQQDSLLFVVINGLDVSATTQSPSVGKLEFASTKTQELLTSFEGSCDVYFAAGGGQGAAPGRVWASFTCPSVVAGVQTCAIPQGYLAFENCAD